MMLKEMKTREDVFVKYMGITMRFSEYIMKMQNEKDLYNFVTEDMLAKIIERENELLAS